MSMLIEGREGPWEVVIGLEIHAQVLSQAKLFSGAATTFGGAPNADVSPVDAAMPGMLPTLNRACVRQAVRAGLALGCRINLVSAFARKHYFYPDLPQGYQISQYDRPIVGAGAVTIDLDAGGEKSIGIERLHLEQDAGKSVHDRYQDCTAVDLNRAGVALMEIVSQPDMRSAAEAGAYLAKVRAILRCVGACDGNMQEGSLRADANVSVRRPGAALGTRCEIKNLNSIRFLRQAIDAEARRQIALLEDGHAIVQQTMLFDAARGETRAMRSKEEAHDYRYFPDPDLPPLMLDPAFVAAERASLPELPDAKKARFRADFGLNAIDAAVLAADDDVAAYYEIAAVSDPALAASWVVTELFGRLNKAGLEIAASPVTASALAGLIDLIRDGVISGRIAKDVFEVMWESGGTAAAIVAERGLTQISDGAALAQVIAGVIAAHPKQAAQYRSGKTGVLGWFSGQVMKATAGRANPQLASRLLQAQLDAAPSEGPSA